MEVERAESWGRSVLSGEVLACKYVKQAVKRHFRLLEEVENGRDDIYFDEDEADFALAFIEYYCKHSQGKWAGEPFILEDWQIFIVVSIFGWKKKNGNRLFRTVYIEVPRKNGKSTFAAAIALYLFLADGEEGAQIYTAATKRDQAKIVFEEAKAMILRSPPLKKKVSISKLNLAVHETRSKMEPLSSDAKSLDGLNIHGAIVDELHAHKKPELWGVIDTGTGAREQPMILAITTAGFDKGGICFSVRHYATQVLEGTAPDESFFGIIFTIDEGDDPFDPDSWRKANPNYGVSVNEADLEAKAIKAKAIPSETTEFLTKHLNVWVNAATAWMSPEKWAACGEKTFDVSDLDGATCYGGLDLASVEDIAAFSLAFPSDGEVKVIGRYYIPEDKVDEVIATGRQVPYKKWVDDGLIVATPGSSIDYDFIEADILSACEKYDVQAIAFDRWNSTALVNHLLDQGVEMVQFGQGFASMSPAMKEAERLILNEQLLHNNDPVLAWAASNVVKQQDPAGNIKPDKAKSLEKIDPVVSMIQALGIMVANNEIDADLFTGV